MLDWIRRIVRATLVVPDAQVRVLDVEYQLYAYELFHRHVVNRWAHALGIPLATCALASMLVGTSWALPAGLALGALHGLLALRVRSPSLMLALAPIHAGIWLFGEHVVGPFLAWAHVPAVAIVIGCAMAQYLGHALEHDVPEEAFFGASRWTARDALFRRGPLRALGLAILLSPFHVAVELVSSPRNLFLLVLGGARGMGLVPRHVASMHDRVERAAHGRDPSLDADAFHRACEDRT